MIHIADYIANGVIDSTAVELALAGARARGCIVQFPDGRHQLQRPIRLDGYGITLRGESAQHPYPGRAATELVWPENTPGIIVAGRPDGQGERCLIQGLCLTSTRGSGSAAGITIFGARTNVRDCSVNGFGGVGCHIGGSVASERTSNLFCVEHSTFRDCGGHGLHVSGNNANVGTVADVSLENNDGWGLFEEGTLGNNYQSCHASGNKLGPYCISTPNSYSTVIGCYSEPGQPPSWFSQKVLVLGGLHGAGIDTGNRNGLRAGSRISSEAYGLQLGLVEALLVGGGPRPKQGGTVGQFIPMRKLGWRCAAPGFWHSAVE